MVLKPPLKQSPAVGTFQCPTHGAALKNWWSLVGIPTATTLRKYHATPELWWREAGTSEASRDGKDNHKATIALWMHGKARVYSFSSSSPYTGIYRERDQGNSTAFFYAVVAENDYFLYLRCMLIISGNLITEEFSPAPPLMWLFLCFLREIRARLTILSGA